MARFTDELREANHDTWEAAINHPFTKELFAGTLDDAIMASYLVQDYQFFDVGMRLYCSAAAAVDSTATRMRLCQCIGALAGDENTYFQRSFEELGVTEEILWGTQPNKATAGFIDLMEEAIASDSWPAQLAILLIGEWIYLDWALKAPEQRPERFIHNEWIELHDFPEFHDRVAFFREEADKLEGEDREIFADFFARGVQFEYDFFDAAYNDPLHIEK